MFFMLFVLAIFGTSLSYSWMLFSKDLEEKFIDYFIVKNEDPNFLYLPKLENQSIDSILENEELRKKYRARAITIVRVIYWLVTVLAALLIFLAFEFS